MTTEFRQFEFRTEGRRLVGTAIRYGSIAQTLHGPERFERGAFGDVQGIDAILNVQHDRRKPLVRTGGGGLTLSDSATALRIVAELPKTQESNDALTLVRNRVLRGLSIEFKALRERVENGIRVISRAALVGIGLVDRPAYQDSLVEIRQDGLGLSGAFHYDVDTIIAYRDAQDAPSGSGTGFSEPSGVLSPESLEIRQDGSVRKRRVAPGAFKFALEDQSREISLILGSYDKPLASRLAGTLKLEDTATALRFETNRLPSTSYVSDFRELLASRAIKPGVEPRFTIPPSETVPNATEIIPEPGNPDVGIEVVKEAVLTALNVRFRPPRGNAGIVERRRLRRRRLWL